MEFYEQFDLLLDISPVYCESLSSTTASPSHLLLRVPLTYYCEFLSPTTASSSHPPQHPLTSHKSLLPPTSPSHLLQHPLTHHNTLSPTTTPSPTTTNLLTGPSIHTYIHTTLHHHTTTSSPNKHPNQMPFALTP